ncbi:hypothetical protein EVAR_79306_1 [Eumeta japonica]|uniref:Uncharacterized protein n=1 Tax=Eumeta variegata TaxID=151549 RepID=A0A4C1TFP3_EUMVA|nr:hypothetical protein EVAR_79306_1 [Eumeta japonica]
MAIYCGKTTLCPTWLQYLNGSARLVQHHTLTEYKREITFSVFMFRQVSESSSGLHPLRHPTTSLHQPLPSPSAHSFLNQISYREYIFLPMKSAT